MKYAVYFRGEQAYVFDSEEEAKEFIDMECNPEYWSCDPEELNKSEDYEIRTLDE